MASDDTIRTHVDASVDRAVSGLRSEIKLVSSSVESLSREIAIGMRSLRERVEGGTKVSGDRFEAHKADDDRRFATMEASNVRRDLDAKDAARDTRDEIAGLGVKLDAIQKTQNEAALREARLMGKVAGAAFVASGVVAVVGWLVDHAGSIHQ